MDLILTKIEGRNLKIDKTLLTQKRWTEPRKVDRSIPQDPVDHSLNNYKEIMGWLGPELLDNKVILELNLLMSL